MKKFTSILIRLALSAVLLAVMFSCSSGGSSSDGDSLQVRVKIDQTNFRSSDARLNVNGYEIASLTLNVSNQSGYSSGDMNILSAVESSGYVTLTLNKDTTYDFSIYAKDTQSNTLCEGSASALIKEGSNSINLVCDSDNFHFETTFITGVAASGLPVTGKVYLKDANGTVVSTDIQPDGSYSINTLGLAPPFILKAEGVVGTSPISMVSYTQGASSVVNINPFTDLAVVMAAGASSSAELFDTPDTFSQNLSNETVKNAVTQVTEIFSEFLESMGITDFDPLSGSYSADGTGADGVLDYVGVNISGGVVTVVNKTTGEALITSSVSSVAQNVITGTVVNEIVQYVSEGPTQTAEAKSFITDLYTTKSRGAFAEYVDTDMVWYNGLSREEFIAQGFPEEDSVTIENFQMYNRLSTTELLVYYYVKSAEGDRKPEFATVIKKDGLWYISGNGRMFEREANLFSARVESASASVQYISGLSFYAADPSSHGVELIVVTGPGLPSAGIRLVPEYDEFVIYEADRTDADSSYEYFFNPAAVTAFNSAVSASGLARYTYTAYTAVSGSDMTPSGEPLQTVTENIKAKLLTSADLLADSSGYFIDTEISEDDLSSIIENSGFSGSLSYPANSILFAKAAVECFSETYGDFYDEISLSLNAQSVSFDTSEIPYFQEGYEGSCTAYLGYMSTTLTYFISGWEFELTDSGTGGVTEPPTDSEILADALESFSPAVILADNISIYDITGPLNLITSIEGGVTVFWDSSDLYTISTDGQVSRPVYGAGDQEVTLTAEAAYGQASETLSITVTVKQEAPTDQQVLDEGAANFSALHILGENDTLQTVTTDLVFPSELENGVAVTWSSGDTSAVSTSGAVTRPEYSEGDVTVTITAVLSYGQVSQQVSFDVTVLEKEPTDQQILYDAFTELSLSNILGENSTPEQITSEVWLLSHFSNGVLISWSSDKPSVVSASGAVTRPSYLTGDTAVRLTGVMTYGSETMSVHIDFTVTALPVTDAELVQLAVEGYSIENTLNANTDAASITTSLLLASSLGQTTVTWESSNQKVITNDGKVYRPTYSLGDAPVTLTATVSLNGEEQSFSFDYTVKESTVTYVTAQAVLAGTGGSTVEIYDLSDEAQPVKLIKTATSDSAPSSPETAGTFTYDNSGMEREHTYLIMVYGGDASDIGYDGVYDGNTTPNNGTLYAVVDGFTAVEGGVLTEGTGTTAEPAYRVSELTDAIYRANRYALSSGQTKEEIKEGISTALTSLLISDVNGDAEIDYTDALAYSPYTDRGRLADEVSMPDYAGAILENNLSADAVNSIISNIQSGVSLGDSAAIAYHGSYMLSMATTGLLSVYDAADMKSPALVNTLPVSQAGFGFKMTIAGNYLFVMNSMDSSIAIIDISSPADADISSILSSTQRPESNLMAVAPDASFMLFGVSETGIMSYYDLTDKSAPAEVAGSAITVEPYAFFTEIDYTGEYVIAGSDSKVAYYSLSTQSQIMTFSGGTESIRAVLYDDKTLYMAKETVLEYVKVENAPQMTQYSPISIDNQVSAIQKKDDYLYTLSSQSAVISLYNMAVPETPVHIRSIFEKQFIESISGFAMNGEYGYVMSGAGTYLIDTSFSFAETAGEIVSTAKSVDNIVTDYGTTPLAPYAYTVSGPNSVAVYSIDQPEMPELVYSYDLPELQNAIGSYTFSSDFFFVKMYDMLYSFDLSDMASVPEPGVTVDIAVADVLMSDGESLYMTTTGTLIKYTLGTAGMPAGSMGYSLTPGSQASSITAIGNYVCVLEDGGLIKIFDKNGGPQTGEISLPDAVATAKVKNDYLMVYNSDPAEIYIYDIESSYGSPVLLGRAPAEAFNITDITSSGDYVYALTANKEIFVYDLTNPAAPKEALSFVSFTNDIHADDTGLFLAKGSQGYMFMPLMQFTLPEKNRETATLETASDALSLETVLNANISADSITETPLLLSQNPAPGVTVFWYSDNESVIGTDGTVTRPLTGEPDAEVTLTAEVMSGFETVYYIYSLTVKAETISTSRVLFNVIADANVEIYGRSDLSEALVSTTTTPLEGTVDAAGFFSYDYTLFQQEASLDELYLVHVYNGTAYDGYYSHSTDSLENRTNIYAIVTRDALLSGNFHVSAMTDILYRHLSYIFISGAEDADVLDMLNRYAKLYIPANLDESDIEGAVDYTDAMVYNPYDDINNVNLNYTVLENFETSALYDEASYGQYNIPSYNVAGSLTAAYPANSLASADAKLYIPASTSGFKVCDLGISAELSSCGTFAVDTGSDVQTLKVFGEYLYLANNTNGFNVIGTANPGTSVASYTDLISVKAVDTDGVYIYVLDANSGLNIFEIDYPDAANSFTYSVNFVYNLDYTTAPYYLSDSQPVDIALAGGKSTAETTDDYLTVVLDNTYLIVDISAIDSGTPSASVVYYPQDEFSNPVLFEMDLNHAVMTRDASILYMASSKGLRVLNLANKAEPSETVYAGAEHIADVFISETELTAVTSRSAKALIYDISSPAVPVLSETFNEISKVSGTTFGEAFISSAVSYGGYLYTAGSEGVDAAKLTDAHDLAYGTHFVSDSPVFDMKVRDGYAYTAADEDIIAIYSLADIKKPALVSRIPVEDPGLSGTSDYIELSGNYAFLNGYNTMYAVNISDPANPTEVEAVENTDGWRMMLSGSLLYQSDSTSLNIYDTSLLTDGATGLSSALTDTYTSTGALSGIAEYAGFLFGTANIAVFPYSQMNFFSPEGALSTNDYYVAEPKDVAVAGDSLAILDYYGETGESALTLLDLTLIESQFPAFITTVLFEAGHDMLYSDGSFLYASGTNGVTIFGFSSTTGELYKAGYIPTPALAGSAYTDDSYLYIPTYTSGMIIVPKPVSHAPFVLNSLRMPIGPVFDGGMP